MVTLSNGEYINRKRSILLECSKSKIDDFKPCLDGICAKCKGSCCKKGPCTLSPREIFLSDPEYMDNLFKTGVLVIAPGDEKCELYIIRPRGKRDLNTVVSGYITKKNSCILLSKKGCILESFYRPTEGLLYIPTANHITVGLECVAYYDEFQVADDWKKHQKELKELIKIYKDVKIPKPIANEETAKIYSLALRGECQKETK